MSKYFDFREFLRAAKANFCSTTSAKNSEIFVQNDDVIYKIKFHNIGNGMIYTQSEITINSDFKLTECFDERYHFLFFNTEQNTPICTSGGKNIYFAPNEIYVGTMDRNFLGQMHYQKSPNSYKTISIMFDENLIKDFDIFNHLEPLCDNFYVRKTLINQNQTLILDELRNAEIYSGKMREIFIESKVLDLVFKSFNAPLRQSDLKLAQKAKEILLKNIANPPSIAKLAHDCATNATTLKIEFKKHFGVSIYEMLQNERLNLAAYFLKAQDISISEAAKLVGYSSLSHFSKIFKAKFGILPTKLIKERKFYF